MPVRPYQGRTNQWFCRNIFLSITCYSMFLPTNDEQLCFERYSLETQSVHKIIIHEIWVYWQTYPTERRWLRGRCVYVATLRTHVRGTLQGIDNFQPFLSGRSLPTCCPDLQSTLTLVTSVKRSTRRLCGPSKKSYILAASTNNVHLNHLWDGIIKEDPQWHLRVLKTPWKKERKWKLCLQEAKGALPHFYQICNAYFLIQKCSQISVIMIGHLYSKWCDLCNFFYNLTISLLTLPFY